MKKRALSFFILGVAVVVSLGIVYIDTTANYWYVNGGFVKLIVSNQTSQAIMTVDTNTLSVGFNSNNIARSFVVQGRKPATATTGNGVTAGTTGAIVLAGGNGGDTTAGGSANGGNAGTVNLLGGTGGVADMATTNVTGGGGGNATIAGGAGGAGTSAAGLATNAVTGGSGGSISLSGGIGGIPVIEATNTVGGNGGAFSLISGAGGQPTAGWARKGGNGGTVTITAQNGANSVRTNGGPGGPVNMTSGSSGSATTTPGNAGLPGAFNITAGNSGSAVAGGNPQPGGGINITAGDGSTGDTNSNGGSVFIAGGAPGSGAVPGNVILARTLSGITRGAGVVIGISNSAVLTNVMFVRTNLDFPSTLSQTDSDFPVLTVAGRTNAIVNVGPPPSALLSGVVWSGFCSNGIVFVRCSVYGALPKDPGIGDFEVEVKAYR